MPVAAAWVLVGLVAILVGCAVPVLLQLKRTLRTAEQTLETTGRRVNDALDEVKATVSRVNRIADGLESGAGRLSTLFEALGGIGGMLMSVRTSLGAAASLGSVLGGALIAAFGRRRRERAAVETPQTGEPDSKK